MWPSRSFAPLFLPCSTMLRHLPGTRAPLRRQPTVPCPLPQSTTGLTRFERLPPCVCACVCSCLSLLTPTPSTSHPEAAIDHAIGAFERAFGTLSNAAADQKQPPPHAKEHHHSEEGIEHSVLAFEHAYVPHPDTAAAAAAATWPSFLGWLWHPSAKPLIPPAPAARQHRGAGPHHHRSEEGIEHAVLAFEHAYVPHPEPQPKAPAS